MNPVQKKYIAISEVEGFIPDMSDSTHIEVMTYHTPGVGLEAFFCEGIYKSDDFSKSFTCGMFTGRRKKVLILPIARKNQKKIDLCLGEFFAKTSQELVNIFNS